MYEPWGHDATSEFYSRIPRGTKSSRLELTTEFFSREGNKRTDWMGCHFVELKRRVWDGPYVSRSWKENVNPLYLANDDPPPKASATQYNVSNNSTGPRQREKKGTIEQKGKKRNERKARGMKESLCQKPTKPKTFCQPTEPSPPSPFNHPPQLRYLVVKKRHISEGVLGSYHNIARARLDPSSRPSPNHAITSTLRSKRANATAGDP